MFITISRYLFLLFLIKSCLHLFPQYNDTFLERGTQPNKIGNNQALNRRVLNGSELSDCDQWTDWSPCSKTCDIGVKIRTRISSNPIHSLFCSKFTETSVCFLRECPDSSERRDRDEREKRKNKKKRMLTKYVTIFCVFSVINIIILLICAIISIKKKII
ncbi:thrombospondin related sporozoite protein, putative [Plasmodium vinckei]|uniref:Thrombospondin related sporozoite protein, putative n=1 Tax=Plasmodium vinckei TaxID=5860 RepID=A0A6V7SCS2_PLAVN|nr:thrombospondin related sporozoite protein, putative [Plasmodium vinckei]